MTASETTTLTIVGDGANFYTNSGGTEGESKTWTIGTSITTTYIKCTEEAKLIIPEQRLIKNWGNGGFGWISSTNAATITTIGFPFRNAITLSINGNNTLKIDIDKLPATLTKVNCWNVYGDLSQLPAGLIYFNCSVGNNVTSYTAGRTWATNFNFLQSIGTSALSVTNITNLIIDLNAATWGGASRVLSLSGSNASMANTTQGGIWGDFSGTPAPSALATAYKNLIRVQSVTVTLNGITVPGGSGDGTGFPAGFGDWYRS